MYNLNHEKVHQLWSQNFGLIKLQLKDATQNWDSDHVNHFSQIYPFIDGKIDNCSLIENQSKIVTKKKKSDAE